MIETKSIGSVPTISDIVFVPVSNTINIEIIIVSFFVPYCQFLCICEDECNIGWICFINHIY